jgi:hypothetical protein
LVACTFGSESGKPGTPELGSVGGTAGEDTTTGGADGTTQDSAADASQTSGLPPPATDDGPPEPMTTGPMATTTGEEPTGDSDATTGPGDANPYHPCNFSGECEGDAVCIQEGACAPPCEDSEDCPSAPGSPFNGSCGKEYGFPFCVYTCGYGPCPGGMVCHEYVQVDLCGY